MWTNDDQDWYTAFLGNYELQPPYAITAIAPEVVKKILQYDDLFISMMISIPTKTHVTSDNMNVIFLGENQRQTNTAASNKSETAMLSF